MLYTFTGEVTLHVTGKVEADNEQDALNKIDMEFEVIEYADGSYGVENETDSLTECVVESADGISEIEIGG